MTRTTWTAVLLTALSVTAQACPERLLVSGYGSDNVHVYDACNGRFMDRVDKAGRIDGAQGLALDAEGRLYVASEENGRVLRYRASDLAFIDVFAGPGGRAPLTVRKPTGVAIGPDGDVFVVGFQSNDVVRLDPASGAELAHYRLASTGLSGADAGIAFLPDGRLLIPGFDSNNVVVLNPETGGAEVLIQAGTQGLTNPRVVRVRPVDGRILVSSWGSTAVLAFDFNGDGMGEVLRTPAPTGFIEVPEGGWLVTSDAAPRVLMFDASAQPLGERVPAGAGGLSGATFLLRVDAGKSGDLENSGNNDRENGNDPGF